MTFDCRHQGKIHNQLFVKRHVPESNFLASLLLVVSKLEGFLNPGLT